MRWKKTLAVLSMSSALSLNSSARATETAAPDVIQIANQLTGRFFEVRFEAINSILSRWQSGQPLASPSTDKLVEELVTRFLDSAHPHPQRRAALALRLISGLPDSGVWIKNRDLYEEMDKKFKNAAERHPDLILDALDEYQSDSNPLMNKIISTLHSHAREGDPQRKNAVLAILLRHRVRSSPTSLKIEDGDLVEAQTILADHPDKLASLDDYLNADAVAHTKEKLLEKLRVALSSSSADTRDRAVRMIDRFLHSNFQSQRVLARDLLVSLARSSPQQCRRILTDEGRNPSMN